MSNLYSLDGRVPLGQAVPFGLQHVLAMFVSNVTPIIILANVAGLEPQLSAALVQNCMVIAGIGTLVQLYPVWRIGSRLPVVMGISFTFLSLAITIATTQGMGSLMGAVIVGGLIEGVLGLCAKYWMKLISPVVAATVVTAIGVSLLPIGANSFAGGQGASDFGSAENWIVGSVTLLVCLVCQVLARGFLRSLSVLVGLVVGYVLACFMGMVHFEGIHDVGIVALPRLLPFKPEFHLGTILSVVAIYLVSATETIGDTTALCSSAVGRDVKPRELQGSIACDGFVSTVAGCFGCTPITSFSQNVGLAALGFVLTTIPQAVLGGCTIMMFGSILFAGINMVARCGNNQRNLVIVATSLSVGLGFTASSEMFNIFPSIVRTVFADNCVAVIFLLALLLNLLLPKEEEHKVQ